MLSKFIKEVYQSLLFLLEFYFLGLLKIELLQWKLTKSKTCRQNLNQQELLKMLTVFINRADYLQNYANRSGKCVKRENEYGK